MRSARSGLLCFLLLFNLPLLGQQPPGSANQSSSAPSPTTQSAPTLPPATKDPQAVSVINQALAAAGGAEAIKAITDFTGTGSFTRYLDVDRNVQGTVTVRGRGFDQFRMDTNLPSGERSQSTSNGPTSVKDEKGVVRKLHVQSPLGPARLVLPYLQLKAALTSNNINLVYKGVDLLLGPLISVSCGI